MNMSSDSGSHWPMAWSTAWSTPEAEDLQGILGEHFEGTDAKELIKEATRDFSAGNQDGWWDRDQEWSRYILQK